MKRIKEFETAWVRISLLCEDGKIWYVREIGMAGNEHDTLQTFQTKEEAEKEYNRLQELLRDNGEAIMETYYCNDCETVFYDHQIGGLFYCPAPGREGGRTWKTESFHI